jgi:hypothetical protein
MTNTSANFVDKGNEALFDAFWSIAQQQEFAVRKGKTGHKYDPIEAGKRPLKNALCVEKDGTTFFTTDEDLWQKIHDAGYKLGKADLSPTSGHNKYRRKISGITPDSLKANPELFEQVVRDSVKYVERPPAGNKVKKS